MNIYVGNLNYDSSEDEVRSLFEEFGDVESVKIITDRDTGRPKGFGFVSMETEVGTKAIDALNGTEFSGRKMVVNEARERVEKSYSSRDRW